MIFTIICYMLHCVMADFLFIKKKKEMEPQEVISQSYARSERRRETRREASRRSTQRAYCHSHIGQQNNSITREIWILAM